MKQSLYETYMVFQKKGKNSNAVSFASFLLIQAFLMLWSYYMLIVISTGMFQVLNHFCVISGSRDINKLIWGSAVE